MSLNCEYISFRTQGHGRHLDLALRTLALPSLEAPAVEGPWPPISPSVSLTPVADKKRSSWASGHFSSSWLTSTCVTCKMTPRIVRQDSLQAALWGRSIFETQLSQVQKMSPHAFYTMAFPHGHLLEAQQFLLYLICKTKNGPIRSSCAEPTSNICCVITPLVSPVLWNKSTPHWINPIWRQFCKNHWLWDQNSYLQWVVMNWVTEGPVSSTTKQERECSLRSIIPQPAHLHSLPREASLHLMVTDAVTANDNAHGVTNEPTSSPSFTYYQKRSRGFPSNTR